MATVVNKTTFEVIESVNTPDYDPNEWLINPVIPDVPKRYWRIVNGILKVKTASQRAASDVENLVAVKENKKQNLKEELGEAVRSKYSDDEKLSLLLILQLAVASGNTARVNYIAQLANWIDQGQNILYGIQDLVDSTATEAGVDSIEMDLESWLSSDPQVVIRTAKGIE